MRRSIARTVLAALVALALDGCSTGTGPVTGVNADKALAMNQERNAFETSEDPPIAAETYFAAGQLAETNGDLAAAVWQSGQAVRLDPKHRRALFRQAACLSQLKKFPEAVACWQKYIDATDHDPRGYS